MDKKIISVGILIWMFLSIFIVGFPIYCGDDDSIDQSFNQNITPPVSEETTIIEPTETTESTTEEILSTESTESTESTIETIIPEPPTEESEPTFTTDRFEKLWGEQAIYMAKTLWGEARGCSVEEQIKVAWCILNRVDHPNFPNTIKGVVTSGEFHGYSKGFPCEDKFYELSLEVIYLWQQEKMGIEVDRLLPHNMYFFSSNNDGTGHIFREEW